MKLNAKKIRELARSFSQLSQLKDLDFDFAFEIADNMQKIQDKIELIEKMAKKIGEKYPVTLDKESGNAFYKSVEEKQKAEKEYGKLNEKEFDIELTFKYFKKDNFVTEKDGKKISIVEPNILKPIREYLK